MIKGKTVVFNKKPMLMDSMPSMPPTFNLSEKDFPAIKGWKVGEKYKLEIVVENIGMNKDEYMDKQLISTRLKVLKLTEELKDNDELKAKKGHY